MANLLEICELAWRQIFPQPGDESKITKAEFISTGRLEYSYQLWLKIMADKREDWFFFIPSYLLTEKELDVVNNEVDLTGLKMMRSLPSEIFIQKVGEVNCECTYVKSTLNLAQVLCDEDSLPQSAKIYYVVGKKIKFPKGAHKTPLLITYANSGENVDDTIEVDDVVGALVRRSLIEIYGGKIPPEDKTNNSKSDS